MIIKVTNAKGQVAYVNNEGQVNGAVEIQGDIPLVSHLNRVLNHHLDLPFANQRSAIDPKLTTQKDGMTVLYKASDVYLKEHFIPSECPVFRYTAEILEG